MCGAARRRCSKASIGSVPLLLAIEWVAAEMCTCLGRRQTLSLCVCFPFWAVGCRVLPWKKRGFCKCYRVPCSPPACFQPLSGSRRYGCRARPCAWVAYVEIRVASSTPRTAGQHAVVCRPVHYSFAWMCACSLCTPVLLLPAWQPGVTMASGFECACRKLPLLVLELLVCGAPAASQMLCGCVPVSANVSWAPKRDRLHMYSSNVGG